MLHAKKELLLHVCCAPCATAVFEELANDFRITAFFYNPNIQPDSEYTRRLEQVELLCRKLGIELVHPGQDGTWLDHTAGFESEPEGGARCSRCFDIRLLRTVHAARALGIETVTTTLTVSPHKNASLINEIGRSAAARAAGTTFLQRDFKKNDGYRKSCELSRAYGLYRQNYCGCLYSLPTKSADGHQRK